MDNNLFEIFGEEAATNMLNQKQFNDLKTNSAALDKIIFYHFGSNRNFTEKQRFLIAKEIIMKRSYHFYLLIEEHEKNKKMLRELRQDILNQANILSNEVIQQMKHEYEFEHYHLQAWFLQAMQDNTALFRKKYGHLNCVYDSLHQRNNITNKKARKY